ncbi:uncharacterized protein [Equus asinus]|uniref:uncharacterized protein n=1 Tax=Equus asinus TaxID=9793 RepID=UPI0038F5DD8E
MEMLDSEQLLGKQAVVLSKKAQCFKLTGFLNKPARPRRYQELGSAYAVARLQPPEGTRPGPRPQSSHPPCARAPGAAPRHSSATLRAQARGSEPAPGCPARPPGRSGVCPCTCPRIARSGAGLRAVLAAAVPPGLPRFGGLSDEPPRPERFRLERHFPEGSGHARSLSSIPFSRASPTLQALDSLCSFPVEESQGGLIRFGRCTTMAEFQDLRTLLFAGNVLPGRAIRGMGRTSCLQASSAATQLHEMSCMQAHSCS